ncbi:hypothetical protein CRP9_gp44 [Roseobacter phage CRP-9]|nr:hypothetical protein CRP9_gp44 [Roseobacter phage CRP-9]
MATKKKLLQAAAGSAGGAGLNVEELFSTYLYTGNGGTQTVINDIDLSNEGGLVWCKSRTSADGHALMDTERGGSGSYSRFNTSSTSAADSAGDTTFNSNGFTLSTSNGNQNGSGKRYTSFSFRKAPKFFDVIRWDGDGTNAREISHNLGAVPHVMITRPYNVSTGGWAFAHYDGTTWRYGELNTTGGLSAPPSPYVWGDRSSFIAPTDSVITVAGPQTGVSDGMNKSGYSYITYLFASNDGGGDFGPTGNQDIIKCGKYTGNGATGQYIDVGFEPQWILVKGAGTSNWTVVDNMRPMNSLSTGNLANSKRVIPSSDGAEGVIADFAPTPTGWYTGLRGDADTNGSGTYIYIAIRRGPMAVPENAADVFDVTLGDSVAAPYYNANFPVDMAIGRYKVASSNNSIYSRITGANLLNTNDTVAESADSSGEFDFMDGWYSGSRGTDFVSWMWKRAPNYFDAVAFTSASSGATTVNHNLGVAPNMIWVKRRDSGTSNWRVYHSGLSDPNNQLLRLNGTNAVATSTGKWSTSDTTFSINDDNSSPFIAYLFASLDGVSKVGSYSGNGSPSGQTIECGFTTGARFIILKQTNNTSNWLVFDTERGITTGNDPYVKLDVTDVETTNPIVDPYSGGFKLQSTIFNASGDDYIFYAVA